MSGYLGPLPVPQAAQRRQIATATAGQTTITTTGYTVGYLDLWMNGVKLVVGNDCAASDGSTIVLTTAATAGDVFEWISLNAVSVLTQNFKLPFYTTAGVSSPLTLNSSAQIPFFKANGTASNISVAV